MARLCLALLLFGTASARAADPPAELKRVRALLLLDTSSNLKADVTRDLENMEHLLSAYIPPGRRTIDVLRGRDVTRERVLSYYSTLKTGPDEALVFFYAGHGEIVSGKGHCLTPQMRETPPIARAEVRKAMEAKNPGLVVLLTDCCSTIRRPPRVQKGPVTRGKPPTGDALHPTVQSLFFQHRGVVDITAAQDGTASFGDPDEGGLFTRALVRLVEGKPDKLDRNNDGFVSWKEFFPQLASETERTFKQVAEGARAAGEVVEQKTQRPRSFSLPDGPESASAESKSYAVVSLLNESGSAVRYRYRFSGETTWKDGRLADKGEKTRAYHFKPLPVAARPPRFELELTLNGKTIKETFDVVVWSGKGEPRYEDGVERLLTVKPD